MLKNSPRITSRLRSSTATSAPNRLLTWSRTTTASVPEAEGWRRTGGAAVLATCMASHSSVKPAFSRVGRDNGGASLMAAITAREVPKARLLELTAAEEDRFRQARARSKALWEDARKVLPRGVPSSFQDAAPQPIFVDLGKGSRIWDVDGNEYVD